MIEVEMKFKIQEKDKPKIHEALERMGAVYKYQQSQSDAIFLERKHVSFNTFIQGDPVIRLRKSNDSTIFTVKRKLDDSSSLEVETECADFDKMCDALTVIGMNKIVEVHKTRQLYELNHNTTISIDSVKELGQFIEIEVLKEGSEDSAEAKKAILSLAMEIGLDEQSIVTKKYDAMLMEIMEEKGLRQN